MALACAVHCIAMPFVSAALPVIGLQFLDSVLFEVGLIGLGLAFGAVSVMKGYRNVHRMKAVPAVFIAGSALLLSGVLFLEEPWELVVVISGAVAVAIAQMINLSLTHKHSENCSH